MEYGKTMGQMYSRLSHAGRQAHSEMTRAQAQQLLWEELLRGGDLDCYCCLPCWHGDDGSKIALCYDEFHDRLVIVESYRE